jgi:hypothetical protein
MKKFKHKLTGDIVTEVLENGDLAKYKTEHGFIAKKFVENSNDWEELIELPVGIKILNTETQNTIEKKENGWFKVGELTSYTDEDISRGILKKRFEIIEEKSDRDFEILSFRSNRTIKTIPEYTILEKEKDGVFRNHKSCILTIRDYEDELLNNSDYNIYSVKRLSDGEIFTLGDKVKQRNVVHNNVFNIRKFEMDANKEHLLVISNGGIRLHKIEHYTPILFTTKDGVNIFKGNEYWFVVESEHSFLNSYKPLKHICDWDNTEKPPLGYVQFSTKEKAEEYILWNKPCLSLNDVASIYPGVNKNHSNTPSHQAERLKELVKSKI